MTLIALLHRDAEFLQLDLVDQARCIDHHIAPGIVLREGDELTNVASATEQGHPAVEAESGATMRRGAEFKASSRKPNL